MQFTRAEYVLCVDLKFSVGIPLCRLDLGGLPRDTIPDEIADRFHQRNFYRATPNVITTRSLLPGGGEKDG